MIKYLVTIEYRYMDIPNSFDSTYRTKTDTIGVFEDIKEAILEGNKVLEKLEKHFELNKNYNIKQRLSEKKLLISNLGYIETPFTFFLKIEWLKYNDSLNEVIESIKRYKEYKEKESE